MPILQQVICDECGTVRGELNRWFVADVNGSGAIFDRMMIGGCADYPAGTLYLCSQKCMMSVFGRWMDGCQDGQDQRDK